MPRNDGNDFQRLKYMFFITAIVSGERPRNPRTFGFAHDLTTAHRYVTDNVGNMHECLYDYIVIEDIPSGIHSLCEREEWYRWTGKRWKWLKKKPAQFRGIVNFALG